MIRILLLTVFSLTIAQDRPQEAPANSPACNNLPSNKGKCKGPCAQKCDGKQEDTPSEEEKVAGMEKCQHWSAQAKCACEGPCSHHHE